MLETYAQSLHRQHPDRPYVTWMTGELRKLMKDLSFILAIAPREELYQRLRDIYLELHLRRH